MINFHCPHCRGALQIPEQYAGQTGGYWRVYALRLKPIPEMSMTMNFENPEAILGELENMMKQMPPEVRQQMENAIQQQGGF